MFRFSRACVHSDWIVYIALPSAWMIRAPGGPGTRPPRRSRAACRCRSSRPCSAARCADARCASTGKKPRPVETPSSTTMAFSGISAPSDCASVAASILPVAGAGGAYFAGSIGCCVAPSSSASHSSAWTMSSSVRRQRGELRVLPAPAGSACPDRRRTPPECGCRPARCASGPPASSAPARPDRGCARPRRARPRAPCGG